MLADGQCAAADQQTLEKGLKAPDMNKNMREISGDRAKAVLDNYKRRQEEEMGELTAAGAAEAVLGDD